MSTSGATALDVPQAVVEQLAATLSPDECLRADRFRAGPLRNRFVVGRATLRTILAKYLATQARQLAFQYHVHGKPDLADPWDRSGLRFNVSHCRDQALFAVAAGRELGIDLERPRPLRHLAGMVERVFSADEQRQWQELPPADRLAGFFHVWTCKEAWLKATGAGLSFPLAEVSVRVSPDEPPRLVSIRGNADEAGQWHLAAIMPDSVHVAAMAVHRAQVRISAWRL